MRSNVNAPLTGIFCGDSAKFLHPLGLLVAFFERGLILLVLGIAGIRPPREHSPGRLSTRRVKAIFSTRPAWFRPMYGMAKNSSTVSPGMAKIETISGHLPSVS